MRPHRGTLPLSEGPPPSGGRWEASFAAYVSFLDANERHPRSRDGWDGIKVGRWAVNQRHRRKSDDLSRERIDRLDAIGFPWHPLPDRRRGLCDAYVAFVEENHRPPEDRESWNGMGVGTWAVIQRRARREGKMSRGRIDALDAIGFSWESAAEMAWLRALSAYLAFVAQEGREPGKADLRDGVPVGEWAYGQRVMFQRGKMDEGHVAKLDEAGFRWTTGAIGEERWERSLAAFASFVEAHGREPRQGESWDEVNVGDWACKQRYRDRRLSKPLSAERRRKLEGIGFEIRGEVPRAA